MKSRYDILIVGGGMVGATLACALGNSELSVAVLERDFPPPFDTGQPYDLRVSALSAASRNILQAVGAWDGIRSRRLCPYQRMKVWEADDERAATEFRAEEIGCEALGHIVENRIIQLALIERLKAFDNVDLICPSQTELIEYAPGSSLVRLADGREIVARLLVAADGGQSRVREAAGIGVHQWDYDQHALVASVETAYGQQDITWQQFTPTGPLAFLPLGGNHASLVWYARPDQVKRLMALDETAFLDELHAAFPQCLGRIERLVARGFFPLRRQHALQYVTDGVALVGDAAHMIHPLAGQGVNIGLLDAAALAETLLDAQAAGERIDERQVLHRYEQARRNHNLLMMQVMDSFYRVFSNDSLPLRLLRNVGLGLAEHAGPIKRKVIRLAMGLDGNLPRLAVGAAPRRE
ncbi:2-octaprenyl-3-methyl-6-methoxy-1,4-benzoquinol hydroxylase [Marinobacterium nitratireducens]|uniref:2-octaprenyl-3-methyl-6-methoxy-1,4-benzoquinol hydroxylase n=1 Tax=Marinobacterium nitratireducens TaxID=518897 RepID=A0A917Z6U7_9GAMM|nr:UbiH/UbiF/VisC/COQ6 family ubiquinone biosynthesis hydroxylase [Marinobacterium nitratireducens]GGO76887.1 2-octaprenyl-3-methyl-6-methoxy-1,4-benzoquinol hydroxylase [Marinobacterium nitratireducens]